MERDYNRQSFTPEEVEKGLHLDLLNYLLDHNKKSENQYYDIHITTDGYCTIIEWIDRPYNNDYDIESFEYVDSNKKVMTVVKYPDNTIDYACDETQAKEMLDIWLEHNPGWKKNDDNI